MTRQSLLKFSVTVPVVLIAALLTSPLSAQQKRASKIADQSASKPAPPPPQKADLKDVARNLNSYVGKTIEVEGEVIDLVPPHLMVIDSHRWFHLWGGVLVIFPEPVAGVIVREDDQVRIVGKVEKLVLAEARKKWSFLSDPKIQIDLLEKPVIVATAITVIPKT